MMSILSSLGEQLRHARSRARLSQAALANRIGRSATRISELERDFKQNRWGRDRLTLLIEICDALGVEPVLLPRAQAAEVRAYLDRADDTVRPREEPASAFEELFIDLDDEQD